MKVVHSLDQIPQLEGPIALSIGVYDGVHLGHQMIIKRLCRETRKKGSSVILTFSNHPSSFLRPNSPAPLLTTFDHRLELLKNLKVDLVIALPFDAKIAEQSYETFFTNLRKHLPFDHLIIGDDARFGKGRAGGPEEIKKLGINVEYLRKETYHKEAISSGVIRHFLEKGELRKAKKMLGRPYSIRLPFDPCNVVRESEVQYKWSTGTDQLCLLPSAVYAVDLRSQKKTIPAIAFYRGTQTINNGTELALTLYFEKEVPAADTVEIIFISHLHDELDPELRPSSKTNLLQALKPEPFPL